MAKLLTVALMVDSTDAGGAPLPLGQALDAAGDSALTGTDAGMMSAHAELSPRNRSTAAVLCSGALALAHHK